MLLTRVRRAMDRRIFLVLTIPALVFVVAMLAIPIGYTLVLSLTDSAGSVRRPWEFVGLANYIEVLTADDRFWPAVWRTALFTGIAVGVEAIFGMAIALLLWKPFRGQGWVRVLLLLPLVATPVAIAMMWLLVFEPTIGFANQLMQWLGLPPQGWISSPEQALPTLMFVDIWQWTPMVALILLAGLSSLPEEPFEAARVDGANAWQRFIHVVVPLLTPAIIAAVLLRSIDALKTFDILYATKGKGGGSSHEVETLNIYAYSLSFDYNEYGLSSAVLIIFTLLIALVCAVLIWIRTRRAS